MQHPSMKRIVPDNVGSMFVKRQSCVKCNTKQLQPVVEADICTGSVLASTAIEALTCCGLSVTNNLKKCSFGKISRSISRLKVTESAGG